MLIIDCHGHYTTAPGGLQTFRNEQIARLKDPAKPPPVLAHISDDEIRESIELNQLKLQRERGADLTIFSPRASAMAHHVGDEGTSRDWTRASNDLIKRAVDLYPDNFVGVCQLPQSPGAPVAHSVAELERCIKELGFVGCNLNPDLPCAEITDAEPLEQSFVMKFLNGRQCQFDRRGTVARHQIEDLNLAGPKASQGLSLNTRFTFSGSWP